MLIIEANSAAGQQAATISTQDAYALYQNGEAFFIDAREPGEWDEYRAPNTILIPLGQLESRIGEITVPKDRPIVVICHSGKRSLQGRDILLQAGFANATSMDGGLKTWRDLGYPIEP